MKHLAQPLGTALLEGGVDPLGSGRALAQRLFYAPLVEALYGGACCLGIAAQRAGDPVGVLSSGAGKQDLAPTEDEGFRRAQALLQCLALGVRERTHEDRSFHSDQRSTLRTTCSEDALSSRISLGGTKLGRTSPCSTSWQIHSASLTSVFLPGMFLRCRALRSHNSKSSSSR